MCIVEIPIEVNVKLCFSFQTINIIANNKGVVIY